MTTIRVFPYKMTSKSAKLLRNTLTELTGRRVYFTTPEYEVQPGELVVHWGAGWKNLANYQVAKKVLNPSNIIARCVNKIDCFEKLDGYEISKVRWTQRIETARTWAENGKKVFCRTNIEGRDGKGLVVANTPAEVVPSNLFTRGETYTDEYRVHTFGGEFLTGLIKVGRRAANPDIRTGGNGWNYHIERSTPWKVQEIGIEAARALRLDFGAIDVIYNEEQDKAWFLEANTAPELGPHTAPLYARRIMEVANAR